MSVTALSLPLLRFPMLWSVAATEERSCSFSFTVLHGDPLKCLRGLVPGPLASTGAVFCLLSKFALAPVPGPCSPCPRMDSMDAVQMAIEHYMLQFFEAARAYPTENRPAEADPADRVLEAYKAMEESIHRLEDIDVTRTEQEAVMRDLQGEYEEVGGLVLSAERRLRVLEERNDSRVHEVIVIRKSGDCYNIVVVASASPRAEARCSIQCQLNPQGK